MVAAVRRGQSQRAVARRFRVGLGHVQYWLARTLGQTLERVDWADQSNAPRQQGRQTKGSLQRRVLALRRELRLGDLGFVGAQAIHDVLRAESPKSTPPSLRTIGRILKANGALDAVRRVRRLAPPAGWYLPDVATGAAELDAFDVIEDLPLEAGPRLDVLTTRALWGPVCGAWVSEALRTRWLCQRLEAHWRQHGCPAYAQFDNDSRFQGTHTHPDVLGQVIRVCLWLEVTPIFAPPREHGPQNLNESFKFSPCQRRGFSDYERPVCGGSVAAKSLATRRAARNDRAPARRDFCTCAGPIPRAPSVCWAIAGKSIRCGFIAWCAPKWIWWPIKFAATGCAGGRRRNSRSSKLSPMCSRQSLFIPPDQQLMAPRFSHFT
jgi:hypothetical protein